MDNSPIEAFVSTYDLVVIGASAGGIEALSMVVAGLPSDFAVPLVIAQHLDPDHLSHLGEILGRHTTLAIHTVRDQEPLLAGVIYVVPADRDVEITDHTVELLRDSRRRPKPSVNRLFSSAAKAHGERLIGVILTGAGSDGAIGARDVKAAGGMVVIENPATAAYASMPLALAPSTVDLVADLPEIGPLLAALVAGTFALSSAEAEATLPLLLDQVRERSGIDFSSYKLPTMLRRLQRRVLATDTHSLRGYLMYLASHPEEYQQLLSSFLIKVTEFFRDPALFSALRNEVLPEIIAHARQSGGPVRCWSAGCATGEEAYSLAILIAEILGDELVQVPVRIFATDLDAEAIAFARRGVYPATALAVLSPEVIKRAFVPLDGAYEVAPHLRSLVIFGQHDLGQRAPFPGIDLVLCRNVLIYFTTQLQRRTLHLFAFALRNGGYLALGKAETPQPLASYFTPVHAALKLYQRTGGRLAVPPMHLGKDAPAPLPKVSTVVRLDAKMITAPSMTRSPTTNEKVGALVLGLDAGVVVVDHRYDIQAINDAAQRLLGILRAAIGEDLIHLVAYPPAGVLRATIDAALHDAVTEADIAIDTMLGERQYLHVSAYPRRHAPPPAPIKQVLLLITEATAPSYSISLPSSPEGREAVDDHQEGWEQERQQMGGHLARMLANNRDLLAANQDLVHQNLGLTNLNEELLVRNEELQTATEEIKTLNEELQATNEELETLGEEQEATVEELRMANDDLQVRSAEVLHLATLRAEQQQRSESKAAEFAAILLGMGDALLVLDRTGTTRFTNPAYVAMFGDEFAVFVAEDDEGVLLPLAKTPQQQAMQGLPFRMTFTLPTPAGGRRWFEANGEPIIVDQVAEGGIVTFRDITDRSLHRLQNEFLALVSHELRSPLTAILGMAQMLQRHVSASDPSTIQSLQLIVRQAQRQRRLIDDLMDMGRLQHGKLHLQMAPVALGEVVVQTVAAITLSTPLPPIIVDVESTPLLVEGDVIRLEQIMTNLLINAIKYAAESKKISVQVRRQGREAEIQITDMGPGIAPDAVPHLFERYYQVASNSQTEQRGLGLGLFLVHELVTAHQGRIEVRSVVGQGTTFIIFFPLLLEGGVSIPE